MYILTSSIPFQFQSNPLEENRKERKKKEKKRIPGSREKRNILNSYPYVPYTTFHIPAVTTITVPMPTSDHWSNNTGPDQVRNK